MFRRKKVGAPGLAARTVGGRFLDGLGGDPEHIGDTLAPHTFRIEARQAEPDLFSRTPDEVDGHDRESGSVYPERLHGRYLSDGEGETRLHC